MQTRAVIDIGSHSALLLIARDDAGGPEVLHEDYVITALGADMEATGRISEQALGRASAAVGEFHDRCKAARVSSLVCVGTSALREAENAAHVLGQLAERVGCPVRVLTEEQEAVLTRRGALSGLDVSQGALGGRSTEIPWPGFTGSLPVGSLGGTERYLSGDPPDPAECRRLEEHVESILSAIGKPAPGSPLVCSGGTATTLASMDLRLVEFTPRLVHGHVIGHDRLDELTARLVGLPVAERRELQGLEPDRAPVMPAGALIVGRLLRWSSNTQITVSARGLTWGVWLAWSEIMILDG